MSVRWIRALVACAAVMLAGCGGFPSEPLPAGTDGGGMVCPGLQCECPCESPMMCGPHNACTAPCERDEDCGRLSGETCIGGLCGVVCTPGGVNDCAAVGMTGSACLNVQGTNVCGYERPASAAAPRDHASLRSGEP